MVRIIKLLFFYIAYILAFHSISTCVYMFVDNGSFDIDFLNEYSTNVQVVMASQFLSTLALGIHLVVGKYVALSELRLSSGKPAKILLASIVMIIGMGMWVNYLSELVRLPDNNKELFSLMMKAPFGIVSIVVLAPLVEELFFRGAVQGFLVRNYGNPWLGIIVSSLIFGLMHANPAQIPFAFILGLVLGWVYHVTGSLLPGMVMHFVNNGSAVVLACICGSTDATFTSFLGGNGAVVVTLFGVMLSVVSILFIRKKLV